MDEPLKRKVAPQRSPLIMPILPTISEEESKITSLRSIWRYRLQYQSMASPSALIIAGGMKLAWSVFESPLPNLNDNGNRSYFLASAWFVGVIFGALLSMKFVQHVTKNAAYCSGGALLILGGFIFTICPTAFAALLTSCLVEGCAYGVVVVQALVTGSEVAHKNIRGHLLSFERISLWFGVCLQLMSTHLWYEFEPNLGYKMHPYRLHGIIVMILGAFGIALALLHRLESPSLLQMQQNDSIAMWTLKRLHSINEQPSTNLLRMRDDFKQMLAHDTGLTCCEAFRYRNVFALIKVTLLRCFAALSLSLPYNRAFITVGWNGLNCSMNCAYLLSLSGLIGSCAGGLLIDSKGRRQLAVITLLLSGIFIFSAGGILRHLKSYDIPTCRLDLEMAAYLMLLHQLFTNLGYANASSVYAAEAFTVAVKAKCIAAMTICEYSLLATMVAIAYHVEYTNWILFFSMGSLSLVFGLLVFLFMPETKMLPLNECLIKFRRTS